MIKDEVNPTATTLPPPANPACRLLCVCVGLTSSSLMFHVEAKVALLWNASTRRPASPCHRQLLWLSSSFSLPSRWTMQHTDLHSEGDALEPR